MINWNEIIGLQFEDYQFFFVVRPQQEFNHFKSKPRFGQKQEVDDDELNREEIIGNEKKQDLIVQSKYYFSFAGQNLFSNLSKLKPLSNVTSSEI